MSHWPLAFQSGSTQIAHVHSTSWCRIYDLGCIIIGICPKCSCTLLKWKALPTSGTGDDFPLDQALIPYLMLFGHRRYAPGWPHDK